MKTPSFRETIRHLFWILVLALGLSSAVVALSGVSPWDAYRHMLLGSLGSWEKLAQVFRVWIPLTLCSLGLLYTFHIGLWNIGVEGQVALGAVGATAVVRWGLGAPSELVLPAALVGAAMCGGLWALAAGLLKTQAGVNEIFAGLGLNFVATGLVLWLIFGPWKQPGIASMSGTETFAEAYWFPGLAGWHVSPYALGATAALMGFTAWMLRATRLGLALKAVGRNAQAAHLLGLSPSRWMLLAMLLAGALAGWAGAYQALAVYHRLIPNISSQYGYLALLVVMLARERWSMIPFIAFFFAALNVGSIQLPMMLRLDSSLAGVIQGSLVLAALAVQGMAWKRSKSS
ncbi:ABC transporter permease [Desulfosoma caldarium]|uniref:Nucleoside ABC transporter membrane protein n=1 Tax=Desulfosoma caldarium TaxID=610254 RepID=A0A3N1VHN9_9BACT|nr:ABC transporter permease [Desulfosoma caldarium]ROR01529.1 nucleoside ABC transporter membrane protein [Desulfosoma caldarium]